MSNYLENIKFSLIDKVVETMKEQGITAYRIAKDHNISEAYLSRVLNKKTITTIDRILILADHIGLKVDDIIFRLDVDKNK